MKHILLLLLAVSPLLIPLSSARASDPKSIGTFGAWEAYVLEEQKGDKVCYMLAKPDTTEPKGIKRGEVAVLLTHRPAEGTKDVFSYMAGYAYKKGVDDSNDGVAVAIDGQKLKLFTQNDMAWAPDAETDARLAAGIRKGTKMVVTGLSSRGTKTKDTYSLKGSTKAYEAITKACGL